MCLFVVVAFSASCVSSQPSDINSCSVIIVIAIEYYMQIASIMYMWCTAMYLLYKCTRSQDNKVGDNLKTCSVAILAVPIKAKHPH